MWRLLENALIIVINTIWLVIFEGFLFSDVSKRPFSSKLNSQVLLFFENKFSQVKVTYFHVIEQRVFAHVFFTSLSSVLLTTVEQYHYCVNSQ